MTQLQMFIDEEDQVTIDNCLVIGYIEMIYDEINEIKSELFGSLLDEPSEGIEPSEGGEYDLSTRLGNLYDDIRNIKYSICS